ncbi:MAG: TolC family protein [Pseudomonadota bacterium]
MTLTLTLQDALARGEEASSLVRRARAERTAVAARDVGASVLLPSNPVVAVGVGRRREEVGGGPRQEGVQYALHAEQTFEIANQRGVRRDEVAKAVDVASWRETWARAETRARVRAVYVGAQLATAQVRAARRREDLVQRLVDGVRTRVETGAASTVDLELARLERGRATRDRITAELATATALSDLRVLIALAPDTRLDLTSPLGAPAAPPPLAALLGRARERRAEFRILQASRSEIDAAVVRLRRETVPNPTLFLDVQRDLPGQTYLGGGIALPLPVWRRNQGELAVARAERGRLAEEEDVTAREVSAEVERAYRAALAFGEMVQTLEREVLPAAEAGVDLVDQGWRAGKFDLFRVIQASREASDARRSQLESLGALWEAMIAVDRATGTP